MTQKKKKGKAPEQKKPKKKLSVSQIVFYTISVLAILSMVLPLLLR